MFELKLLFFTGIFALILLLLLRCRVWVLLEYETSGLHLWIGVGAFYISLYPMNLRRKKRNVKKVVKRVEEKEKKEGAALEPFREFFHLSLEIAQRFQQKLCIDLLQLHLNWGAEDPADAAISYGFAHAVMNSFLALLEVNFTVKEKNTRIQLDYSLDKPNIYAKASCSLAVKQAFSLGLYAGRRAFTIYRKQKKKETMKKAV